MMRALETKVPPLALTALLAIAAWVSARWLPWWTFSFPGQVLLAAALVVAGAVISVLGVLAFRAHQTTVNPTAPASTTCIVTSGVYGYSRNPMYLGFALTLAGIVVYLGNIVSVLVVPAYLAYMTRYQIKPEERSLLGKFGEPFSSYMARVRRWL